MSTIDLRSSRGSMRLVQVERLAKREAQNRLRRSIEAGVPIRFTAHARQEMANDDLSEVDVINILQRGLVEEPEWEHGEWRYQVRTQKMTAVVSLHEAPDRVVLVTVWRQTRR